MLRRDGPGAHQAFATLGNRASRPQPLRCPLLVRSGRLEFEASTSAFNGKHGAPACVFACAAALLRTTMIVVRQAGTRAADSIIRIMRRALGESSLHESLDRTLFYWVSGCGPQSGWSARPVFVSWARPLPSAFTV